MSRKHSIVPDDLMTVAAYAAETHQPVRKVYRDIHKNPELLPPTIMHRGKRHFVISPSSVSERRDPTRWEKDQIERKARAAVREHRELVSAAAATTE